MDITTSQNTKGIFPFQYMNSYMNMIFQITRYKSLFFKKQDSFAKAVQSASVYQQEQRRRLIGFSQVLITNMLTFCNYNKLAKY